MRGPTSELPKVQPHDDRVPIDVTVDADAGERSSERPTVADASGGAAGDEPALQFDAQFAALFSEGFPRLFRYLQRLCGDADLAADLAQDTFVRLYQRGALPDAPAAWLVSVAMNLFRNAVVRRARRQHLLTRARAEGVLGDAPPVPDALAADERERTRVRTALDGLPERERQLLLLRAEAMSYHEIALALELNEASVGTLLARAKRAFRHAWEEAGHAS